MKTPIGKVSDVGAPLVGALVPIGEMSRVGAPLVGALAPIGEVPRVGAPLVGALSPCPAHVTSARCPFLAVVSTVKRNALCSA